MLSSNIPSSNLKLADLNLPLRKIICTCSLADIYHNYLLHEDRIPEYLDALIRLRDHGPTAPYQGICLNLNLPRTRMTFDESLPSIALTAFFSYDWPDRDSASAVTPIVNGPQLSKWDKEQPSSIRRHQLLDYLIEAATAYLDDDVAPPSFDGIDTRAEIPDVQKDFVHDKASLSIDISDALQELLVNGPHCAVTGICHNLQTQLLESHLDADLPSSLAYDFVEKFARTWPHLNKRSSAYPIAPAERTNERVFQDIWDFDTDAGQMRQRLLRYLICRLEHVTMFHSPDF